MAETLTQPRKLTEKQERFCIEYVLNKGNATEAAARAGYSDEGEWSLSSQGYENLKKPQIIARISQIREESGVLDSSATLEWALAVLVAIADKRGDSFECRNSVAAVKAIADIMGWSGGMGSTPKLEKIADKIAEQCKAMKAS